MDTTRKPDGKRNENRMDHHLGTYFAPIRIIAGTIPPGYPGHAPCPPRREFFARVCLG